MEQVCQGSKFVFDDLFNSHKMGIKIQILIYLVNFTGKLMYVLSFFIKRKLRVSFVISQGQSDGQ